MICSSLPLQYIQFWPITTIITSPLQGISFSRNVSLWHFVVYIIYYNTIASTCGNSTHNLASEQEAPSLSFVWDLTFTTWSHKDKFNLCIKPCILLFYASPPLKHPFNDHDLIIINFICIFFCSHSPFFTHAFCAWWRWWSTHHADIICIHTTRTCNAWRTHPDTD